LGDFDDGTHPQVLLLEGFRDFLSGQFHLCNHILGDGNRVGNLDGEAGDSLVEVGGVVVGLEE